MLAMLTAAWLLGIATVQETPAPECTAEEQANRVELKAAVRRITDATCYRFEARAQLGVAAGGAAAGCPAVGLRGEYQRSAPLRLEACNLEVLRLSGKVVFRNAEGAWELLEAPPPRDAAREGANAPAEVEAAPDPDLWLATVLPAPHEILESLEDGGKDVRRTLERGAGPIPERVVYETCLPASSVAALAEMLEDPGSVACVIRVTTGGTGNVQEVELTVSPDAGHGAPAGVEASRRRLSLAYRLEDANGPLHVEVPPEAYSLLLAAR